MFTSKHIKWHICGVEILNEFSTSFNDVSIFKSGLIQIDLD